MDATHVWEALSASLAELVAAAPGSETTPYAGATAVVTSEDDATANRLYVYRSHAVDEPLRSFVEQLRSRGLHGMVIAGRETGPAVGSLGRELGLRPAEPLPLLVARSCELEPLQPRGRPPVVEPAQSPSALAEMRVLMQLVLEAPADELARLYPDSVLELPGVRAFIARRDGQPVSCVTTISRQGFTAIFNVGTRPDRRGRGEASALLAAVLSRLRDDGGELFALNAAPGAGGLYERLGFTPWDDGIVWQVDPQKTSTGAGLLSRSARRLAAALRGERR